jgi:hypothetical protein
MKSQKLKNTKPATTFTLLHGWWPVTIITSLLVVLALVAMAPGYLSEAERRAIEDEKFKASQSGEISGGKERFSKIDFSLFVPQGYELSGMNAELSTKDIVISRGSVAMYVARSKDRVYEYTVYQRKATESDFCNDSKENYYCSPVGVDTHGNSVKRLYGRNVDGSFSSSSFIVVMNGTEIHISSNRDISKGLSDEKIEMEVIDFINTLKSYS